MHAFTPGSPQIHLYFNQTHRWHEQHYRFLWIEMLLISFWGNTTHYNICSKVAELFYMLKLHILFSHMKVHSKVQTKVCDFAIFTCAHCNYAFIHYVTIHRQHGGVVVSTVYSQVPGSIPRVGPFCSLYVLPMFVWVFSRYSRYVGPVLDWQPG